MIRWSLAKVISCTVRRAGIQHLKVRLQDGQDAKAIHYTDHWPLVSEGDDVLINTTAVDLSLGTGGYHFVHCVLKNLVESKRIEALHEWRPIAEGHIMKLRYTPLQRAVFCAEEQNHPNHSIYLENQRLDGIPVLIGELHSMLPVAMSWLHYLSRNQAKKPKIAYIMSDGGALPIVLSDHVSVLYELGWMVGTITYGQAYGGDIEAINKYTALIAARHILQADIVLMMMGPGITGTGTRFGFTGIETGEMIQAVNTLKGAPIMIPRISFTDHRERHQGISHHTLTVLQMISMTSALFPLPRLKEKGKQKLLERQVTEIQQVDLHQITWVSSIEIEQIRVSLDVYPRHITTMGRGFNQDPDFFLGVCSAAQIGWEHYLYSIDEGDG